VPLADSNPRKRPATPPPWKRRDDERMAALDAARRRIEQWLRDEGAEEWTGDDAALAADLRLLLAFAAPDQKDTP